MTMSINNINYDYKKDINPIQELSQVRQETPPIRQQLNKIDREINLRKGIIANNAKVIQNNDIIKKSMLIQLKAMITQKGIIQSQKNIIQSRINNNLKMIELYKETNRKLLALKSNNSNTTSSKISNKNLIKSEELTTPKVALSDKSKHTEKQAAKIEGRVTAKDSITPTANDNYFKKKPTPEYVSIYKPTKEQTIQFVKTQDSVIENNKSENTKNMIENTFNYSYRSNIYTELISKNLSKLL
jgi:hypothetical protein